jgi:hypothetical protein
MKTKDVEELQRIAALEAKRQDEDVKHTDIIRMAVQRFLADYAQENQGNGNGGTKKPAESSKKTQHNRGVMAAEEPPALALATEVPQLYVDGKKIPPDLNSVINFFQERGSTKDEAEHFYDHFQGNGWRVSKVAMKDWHAAARNWIRNAPAFKARATGKAPVRTLEEFNAEIDESLQRLIDSGYFVYDQAGNLRVAGHENDPLIGAGGVRIQ